MLTMSPLQVIATSYIVQGWWDFFCLFLAVMLRGVCPLPLEVEFLACLLYTAIQCGYHSNPKYVALDSSLKYGFI